MMKSRTTVGTADVTFVLDSAVGANEASVCGDFNQWSGASHAMVRADDGSFSLTLSLETGRRYRFRYLLDGDRWENDWAADEYVPNDFGGDDSLIDLTALAEDVPPVAPAPPPARSAPAKKAPSKAQTAKKASPKAQTAKKAPSKAQTTGKAAPKIAAAKKVAGNKAPAERASSKKTRG